MTWTTRYNHDYWISVDGLGKTYDRADVEADSQRWRQAIQITTKNITRLALRETGNAKEIKIDGQTLNMHPRPEMVLEKDGSSWKPVAAKWSGLHKTHALQGPIDDAFLDPFLWSGSPGRPGMKASTARRCVRWRVLTVCGPNIFAAIPL